MTSAIFGGLLVPILFAFAFALGFAIWRTRAGRLRRLAEVQPGRQVIATNLVRSRRRLR